MQERIIIHENVSNFGTKTLQRVLGDLYVLCPSVLCPTQLGWPIRRKRQVTVLLHRDWLFGLLTRSGREGLCDDGILIGMFDLEGTVLSLAGRASEKLKWPDFIISDHSDVLFEKQWARERPDVRKRWEAIGRGETMTTSKGGEHLSLFPEDHPDSVLAWCLPTERRRLDDVTFRLKDNY